MCEGHTLPNKGRSCWQRLIWEAAFWCCLAHSRRSLTSEKLSSSTEVGSALQFHPVSRGGQSPVCESLIPEYTSCFHAFGIFSPLYLCLLCFLPVSSPVVPLRCLRQREKCSQFLKSGTRGPTPSIQVMLATFSPCPLSLVPCVSQVSSSLSCGSQCSDSCLSLSSLALTCTY